MSRWFEDVAIGETLAIGSHTFTAEEIKAFARLYDPQPFHLDETAAEASHFGALCASGWHTAAIWMRLMVAANARMEQDPGDPGARFGPSPGFRDLKWLRPVYAGDMVSYTSTVVEKRPSASRPQWGLLTHRNTGTNQHCEVVFEFVGIVFLERRPA